MWYWRRHRSGSSLRFAKQPVNNNDNNFPVLQRADKIRVLECLRLQQIKCGTVCSKTKLNYQNKYKPRGGGMEIESRGNSIDAHRHKVHAHGSTVTPAHTMIEWIWWSFDHFLDHLDRFCITSLDGLMCVLCTPVKRRRKCVSKQIELNVSPDDDVRLKFAISTKLCTSDFSYRFVHRGNASYREDGIRKSMHRRKFNSSWTPVIVDVRRKLWQKFSHLFRRHRWKRRRQRDADMESVSVSVSPSTASRLFRLNGEQNYRHEHWTCECDWIECALCSKWVGWISD